MSLYKRLHEAQQAQAAGGSSAPAPAPTPPGGAGAPGHGGPPPSPPRQTPPNHGFGQQTAPRQQRDPILDALRQKIHHHVIEEIGPVLFVQRLTETELRRR